jgi:transcription initiation factor TFIIIB Brf1 subunit/transcription initiation factor TFIIB
MRGEDRRWTFYRIRKRQGKIAVEGTVTLRKAYSIIDRILEGCGVKSWEMKKQARDYFRRCHSKGLCKGKHSSILAAATSYLGLRYGGVSTSLDEIAESLLPLIYLSHWEFYDEELKRRIEKLSSLPEKKRKKKEEKEKERFRRRKIRDLRKQISSFYRYILREMGWSPPLQNPIEYIPKIASLIEDPMKRSKLEKIAIEIAKQARERKLVGGKSPISIAAASIYMASQVLRVNLTQENIAREAGVTEVTVRKYYRLLANSLYDLFPISRRKNRPFLESRRKKRRFWAWLS